MNPGFSLVLGPFQHPHRCPCEEATWVRLDNNDSPKQQEWQNSGLAQGVTTGVLVWKIRTRNL